MDVAMAFIIIGGLLEPVWVVALKKFDAERRIVSLDGNLCSQRDSQST